MKTTLLSLLTILLSLGLLAQSTVNRKIASRHDDYINNAWEGKDSAVFGYNAFGHEANRLLLKGQSTATWNNFLRSTSDYDVSGNLTGRTTETWNNGAWKFTTKYTYSYNINNQQTQVLYQVWNAGSSSWGNTGRILYTYNGNQDIAKTETFSWNSSWIPTSKKDHIYNTNNILLYTEYFTYINSSWERTERLNYQFAFGFVSNLESMVDDNVGGWVAVSRTLTLVNGSATPPRINSVSEQMRDTVNGLWVDSLRTTYSYFNNNLTQIFRDEYNAATSVWEDISKNDMTYNSSNQLAQDIFSDATSSALAYESKKEYTYNANNLNDKITYYNHVTGTTWIETERDSYTYNLNDSLTYNLKEDYVSNSFVPNKQYFYYYDNVSVGINEVDDLFNSATLYPNPSTDFIKISSDEKIEGAYLATIFSMQGKRVWSQMSNRATDNLQFDVSRLSQGNYILQVKEISTGHSSQFKFQKK